MKQLVSVLLASVLVLCAVLPAIADVQFRTDYFSMTLPDGSYIDKDLDIEEDLGENIESLGIFCPPEKIGLVVGAYRIAYEDTPNVSLWVADEAELQEYADAVMEDLADDQPVYLGIVKAGSIPFVVVRGTDSGGDYLYAETLLDGSAIEFWAFVADEEGEMAYPLTDELIGQFKSILATFKPTV